MSDRRRAIGSWGEQQAARFLVGKGYRVAERNYRLDSRVLKKGEIDIIAWHNKLHFGRTLCFIEVKTRTSRDGSAERSAGGKKKRAAFFRTARHYCVTHGINLHSTPIQFEVVSVYLREKAGTAIIRKYEMPVL